MSKKNILYLTELAILTAVIFLMFFTPLGYLRMPAVQITFIQIPVIVGAITMGPAAGAVLGGMFGLTSFLQCFGLDPFGTMLFGINPVFTAIMCLVPRILMGIFVALIFKALRSWVESKKQIIAFLIPALSGALINTLLFMGGLLLLFGNTSEIQGLIDSMGGGNVLAFFVAFVGINGLVEAIACATIGTILAGVVYRVNRKMRV